MAVKTRVNVRAWSETTPGGTEYYIDGNKILGIGATIPLANLADFTRGDLIVGGAVQWQDLAHPGAAGRVLTTDATDTLWGTYALTGTTGGTTHLAVTNTKTLTLTAADSYNLTAAKTGTLPVGTGTAGRIAEWVTDANTLQASTLIKSGAGVLTLTAGGAYTVTVSASCAVNQDVTIISSPSFAGVTIIGDMGFAIADESEDDYLIIRCAELTADRMLTLNVGDASRTLTLSGNPTLGDWFDQSVKQAASPTFANVIITSGGYVGVTDDVRVVINATAGQINMQLDDAAGADEWRVVDSGSVAVATVDSDGNGYFAGNVGIGVSPTYKLDVVSSGLIQLQLATTESDTTNKIGRIGVRHYDNTEEPVYVIGGSSSASTNGVAIGGSNPNINAATEITFWTATNNTTLAGTERMRVNSAGNVLIGTTTGPGGTATKCIIFGDNGGNPTPGSNTAGIFAKDVSGTVEMFAVDEAGNVAQLTPHNYDGPVQPLRGVLHWSQYHRNEYAGVEKWYDMERALLALEELTGEKFVHTQRIAKRPKPAKCPQWLKSFK